MFPLNQTKETNVSNVWSSSESQGQNETIQSASPKFSTCAIQTEQSPN